MSGRYKGYSPMLLAVSITLLVVCPDIVMFLEDYVDSAAQFFAAVSPTLLGLVLGYFTFRLPCCAEADEKTFTIVTAGIKRSFRIGEISEITCEYKRHYSDRTQVTLTVTDGAGKRRRFREIHYNDIAHVKFDDNAEKPQLKKLCEYVNAAKGVEIL